MESYLTCEDIKNPDPIPNDKRSFAEFYLEQIDKFPDSFIVNGVSKDKVFFAELSARIRYCSSNLLKMGYTKGDTICLFSKNSNNFIASLLACSLCHVTVSPANPAYTGKELLYQLEMSDSNAIFIASNLMSALKEALDLAREEKKELFLKEIFVMDVESQLPAEVNGIKVLPFHSLLETGDGVLKSPETEIDPKEDTWILPFSSGTTGLPKGVSLTHHNMLANVLQFAQYNTIFRVNHGHTILAVLPMYHIYGLYVFSLCAPVRGANVVLLPEFQPVTFLTAIQEYRVTQVYIVPPLALFLCKDPRVKEYDLTTVQDVVSAAAPLAADVAAQTYEQIRSQGAKDVCVRQAWGMTELSPVGTVVRYNSPADALGCIGDPIPFTEVKVIDLNTGVTLPRGEEGELCVRGPQVMKGYFKDEEATLKTINKEGWLMTGDIAKMSISSQLSITDRLKELIKTKGFQVAPAELEGVILTHPSVQDCCVFGVPHPSLGEAPSAAVVMKPGHNLPDKELHSFVSSKVAPYKQLAGGIRIVDAIPKTASGKLLRRVIRAKFL